MTTTAEILSGTLPKGTPVENLAGTVVNAYPIKTGVGGQDNSQWRRLDFDIDGGDGRLCKVAWWEPTVNDPNLIKGQQVRISFYMSNEQPPLPRGAMVDCYQKDATQPIVWKVKARGGGVTVMSAPAAAPGYPAPAPTAAPPAAAPAYAPPPAVSPTAAPVSAPAPVLAAPAPSPTAAQIPTDDQILSGVEAWWSRLFLSIPDAGPEAMQKIVTTLAIHACKGEMRITMQRPPTPIAAPAPAPAAAPPADDDIPF